MSAEAAMLARISEQLARAAQAERDAIELHAALAEAIRRISFAHGWIVGAHLIDDLRTDDLLEVLDRTSRPDVGEAR